MEFWIKAGQLILSLSILIVLHEFGHYIPAKAFKTRVEKFYLFFDWKFSLFKKKIKETEWGIGWIPLGGYVKISGMIDESMDKEQMKKDPQPWEFRSKKTWQRLIIMIGGIVVNLIVGIVIYILVLLSWGDDTIKVGDMPHGYAVGENLEAIGFRDGDQILEIDGETPDNVRDINIEIMVRGAESVKVLHADNTEEVIAIADTMDMCMFKNEDYFTPRVFARIDTAIAENNAAKAGLMDGDSIVGINGASILYWDEVMEVLKESKNETVDIAYYRGDVVDTAAVEVDSLGRIGVGLPTSFGHMVTITHREYSLGESIPAGWNLAITTLTDYAGQLKFLFTSKGASSIGGFGTFGKLFSPTWDWHQFWLMTAFISIVLAFMNFLPIPALDGGHIMFLLYEMITGRKPNEKAMEIAQMIGIILLIGLLLYANGNDLYKWITGG